MTGMVTENSAAGTPVSVRTAVRPTRVWTPGVVNGGVDGGSSATVQVFGPGAGATYGGGAAFSVCAVFKVESGTSGTRPIIDSGMYGLFLTSSSTISFYVVHSDGTSIRSVSSSTVVTDGTFYHACGVYTPFGSSSGSIGHLSLYVNGGLEGTLESGVQLDEARSAQTQYSNMWLM